MEGSSAPESLVPSGPPPDRLTAAAIVRKAEKPVRDLRAVAWGPEVAERFFAAGAKELPQVSYTPLDAGPVHEALAAARALIDGDGPVQAWLRRRHCDFCRHARGHRH